MQHLGNFAGLRTDWLEDGRARARYVQHGRPPQRSGIFIALMGWTLRSVDGTQVVLDVGDWGSAVFKGGAGKAAVESFSFVVEPWASTRVQSELQARGLSPKSDNGANGFESFWVNDPDGWPIQICNGNGLVRERRTARANAKLDRFVDVGPPVGVLDSQNPPWSWRRVGDGRTT